MRPFAGSVSDARFGAARYLALRGQKSSILDREFSILTASTSRLSPCAPRNMYK